MSKKRDWPEPKHRGGYESGPKTVDELSPPPANVSVKQRPKKSSSAKKSA